MYKKLLATALITCIAFPGASQAQSDKTLLERMRAVGIAAGFNCKKSRKKEITPELVSFIKSQGLGEQINWLKSKRGAQAIEIFLKTAITTDCKNKTGLNAEEFGQKIYPYLIDEQTNRNNESQEIQELEHLYKKAQEQDQAGENLESLKTRERMLILAEKTEITKESHGSIYMGAGMGYLQINKLGKAIAYLAKAEEYLVESLGETHQSSSLATVLYGEALFKSGKKEEGISKIQKLLSSLNKEKENSKVAEIKINAYRTLAYLQLEGGAKEKSRISAKEAKRLIKIFKGESHKDLVLILSLEASSYQNDGFVGTKDALIRESLFKEIVNISRKHGNASEQVDAYLSLGQTQTVLEKYEQAESAFQKALMLQKEAGGTNNKTYASILYFLEGLYSKSNQLSKSLAVALELKQKSKDIYGEKSPEYVSSLIKLSGSYNSIGQYDNAYTEAIAAYRLIKQDLKENKKAKQYLNATEIALRNTRKWRKPGDTDDASQLIEKADLIVNKTSLSYTETVNAGSLVTRLRLINQFEKAYALHKRLIKSYTTHLGEKHKTVLKEKTLGAGIIQSIRPNQAIDELLEIEDKFIKAFSQEELAIGEFYSSLATAYWWANKRGKVDAPLKKSVIYTLRYLKATVPTLGDSQRLAAAITYSWPLDLAFSGASEREERAELAYFTYVNRRGMLSEIEKRNRELLKNNPGGINISRKIQEVNQKLSKANQSFDTISKLQKEKEMLQLALNKTIGSSTEKLINKDDIANSMDNQSILIEVQKYWRMEVLEEDEGEFYQAFMLKPTGQLVVVQLGAAEKIDKKIKQLRTALLNQSTAAESISRELSEIIFNPLSRHGLEGKTIYLTLDGNLQSVPISMMQKSLPKTRQVRLISASKDLVNLKHPSKRIALQPVIISNPTFDLTLKKKEIETQAPKQSKLRGWDKSVTWQLLPGTKKEGEKVSQLINGLHVSEEAATTSAVLGVSSPKILHIATHGFYYPSPATRKSNSSLAWPEYNQLDNPLVRSGIVLAGANNPTNAGENDGVLTALELLSLDLEGTKLVTLSACDTGRGDNISGEGLFGLQRALNIAGTRSMILSLWQVDDAATAAFMSYFYEQANKGIGIDEALAKTQSYFQEHPIPAWRHPFYWSAFQLIGDWRPISG